MAVLALSASSVAVAQDVRDSSGFGMGLLNHAFHVAADAQGRTDWPIKNLGRPGTAVRLTFDPRNADALLITDRRYGTGRLLSTERLLAVEVGLPKTDFIRYPETHTAANVDMEFNRRLSRSSDGTTTFDFDLTRFAAALLRSDLPRPIIMCIRANHSRLNRVRLVTIAGMRKLEGFMFLRADDVQQGTWVRWRAQIQWTGYVVAVLLFVLLPLAIVGAGVRAVLRPRSAPFPAPDPEEVRRTYDHSPSMVAILVGVPVLLGLVFELGIAPGAFESMIFLMPAPMRVGALFGLVVVPVGTILVGLVT